MNALFKKEDQNAQCATQENCRYVRPATNIVEATDAYVLEVEMPGVRKDGLDITLEDNQLTLTGRRADDVVKGEPVHRESVGCNYRRSFALDQTIDAGAISAKIDNGVLTVRLPKVEKIKPRRIAVE